MRRFPLSLLFLALLCGACVSTNSVLLGGSGTYPEIEPNQVRIFLTETDVEVPFDKIALITASGSTNLTGEVELIKAMRKKAASLGANGLILGEIREPPLAAEIAGDLLGFDFDRRGRAVAIRIRETPAQPERRPTS